MAEQIPNSNDAEQSILSCMFLDNACAEEVLYSLNSDDFYSQTNKILFECCQEVYQSKKVIDIVMITDNLKAKGNFEKIGGITALSNIASASASSVHYKQYIQVLKEKAYFRRKIEQGRALIKAGIGQDRQKLYHIDKEMEHDGIQTQELQNVPHIFADFIKDVHMKKQQGKSISGISTGFDDLDLYIGGLQKGNLIVVAGRPAMGKTAFALDLLRNASQNMEEDHIALLFSLEMDRQKIATRMFSAQSSMDNCVFRVDNKITWQNVIKRIQQECDEFEENTQNIYIDDTPGISLDEIYDKCYSQQIKTGKKIGLVVVDYLQIMGGKKTDNRVMDVAYLSMGLKNLSRQFCCPVVALSQLSRANERRTSKKPELSDLRDSGAIEQDADIVILLHREKYYYPDSDKGNISEIIVAKNRNGAIGTVELAFLEQYTTFRNCEK